MYFVVNYIVPKFLILTTVSFNISTLDEEGQKKYALHIMVCSRYRLGLK